MNVCVICQGQCIGRTCSGARRAKLSRRTLEHQDSARSETHAQHVGATVYGKPDALGPAEAMVATELGPGVIEVTKAVCKQVDGA